MGSYVTFCGYTTSDEERARELDERMQKLLYQGGMMQISVSELFDTKICLLKPAQFDENGKIRYCYNYFDDEFWESAGYNKESHYLWSNKVGSHIFSDVTYCGYLLEEFYSDEFGLVNDNGDYVNIPSFIGWLNYLFDAEYTNERIYSNWKAFRFVHSHDEDFRDIRDLIFTEEKSDLDNWIQFMYIEWGIEGIKNYYNDIDWNNEDLSVVFLVGRIAMIESFCLEFKETGKEFKKEEFIAAIIDAFNNGSDKIKYNNNTERFGKAFSFTAFLPIATVYIYSKTFDFDFWKTMDSINAECPEFGQSLTESLASPLSPVEPIRTSDFLRQISSYRIFNKSPHITITEADRLYYWNPESDDVLISEETKFWLHELSKEYNTLLEESRDIELYPLKDFIKLMNELDKTYVYVLPFETMFVEFIERLSNIKYIAAIKLIESLHGKNKDQGLDNKNNIRMPAYGFELESSEIRYNSYRMEMKRILALMANKELRRRTFGF